MKKSVFLLLFLIACTGRAVELPSWAVDSSHVDTTIKDGVLFVEVSRWDVVWGRAFVLNDAKRWVEVGATPRSGKFDKGWRSGFAEFELALDGFKPGETYYVITYACEKGVTGWDCNNQRWMLSSFVTVEASEETQLELKPELKGEFVFYYGSGKTDVLSKYKYAVVNADQYSSGDLNKFNAVCYVSVGEIPPEGCGDCDSSVFVRDTLNQPVKNSVWGSFFADVSSPAWKSFVFEQSKSLISKGCKGLFLDTVDSVETGVSDPVKRFEIVSLIESLDSVSDFIVLNRGTVWVGGFDGIESRPVSQHVVGSVDVVLIESFGTTFEFASSGPVYSKQSDEGMVWLDQVAAYLKDMPVDVWVLDYRGPNDDVLKSFGKSRAESHGFKWSSSSAYLDSIYES